MSAFVRALEVDDAASMARIYNAAVEKRLATFDASPTPIEDFESDLAAHLPTHPGVAVEFDDQLVAYALSSPHSSYEPYRGIAEFSIYVGEAYRGRGFGRIALHELMTRCAAVGFNKMLSRILTNNVASRALCASLGFREVGIYERHAQLDGAWHDVVIVEKLLRQA